MAAPADAASAPLVTMAATAPHQTSSGAPKRAAIVAAVIWPTSPHSEKKIAAKETIAAREGGYSFFSSRLSGFRQSANAMAKKLTVVTAATSSGGSVEIALPIKTATAILAMNATSIPNRIGSVR